MSEDLIDRDRVAGIVHAVHRPLIAAESRPGLGQILVPSEQEGAP